MDQVTPDSPMPIHCQRRSISGNSVIGWNQWSPRHPLIQLILRRADLVKLLIFPDKACALRGCFLKDQLW